MCLCSKLWNSACLWSPRQLNPGPNGLDPAGRAPMSDKRRASSVWGPSCLGASPPGNRPSLHLEATTGCRTLCPEHVTSKAISFLTHSYCLFHFLKYNSSILRNNLHIVRFTHFRFIVWFWQLCVVVKKRKKQHNLDVKYFHYPEKLSPASYRQFSVPTPRPWHPLICCP